MHDALSNLLGPRVHADVQAAIERGVMHPLLEELVKGDEGLPAVLGLDGDEIRDDEHRRGYIGVVNLPGEHGAVTGVPMTDRVGVVHGAGAEDDEFARVRPRRGVRAEVLRVSAPGQLFFPLVLHDLTLVKLEDLRAPELYLVLGYIRLVAGLIIIGRLNQDRHTALDSGLHAFS